MTHRPSRIPASAIARASVTALCAALLVTTSVLTAHQAAPPRQLTADQARQPAEMVFKNIQVLKGVPADEFLGSMGFISNALAVNCTYCHLGEGGGGWDEYAKDNDKKVTARRMIAMMRTINQNYFAGRRVVTCVSCHNNHNRPKTTTSMSSYYSLPTSDEPDDITRQAPGAPSVDEVIAKYIEALGGAQKLNARTSFTAKGTSLAYGDAEAAPLQIFARAPAQRTEIVTSSNGVTTTTFDGRTGWLAVPEAITPLSWRALYGAELEGVKLDAVLDFPTQLKAALTNWVGAVPSAIGDTDVQVIQGTMPGGYPVKLYFDDETGLLVRQIRYTESPVGRNTWQIDYSDYKDVGGMKMPFKWIFMWQSGKNLIELTDVQPNVAIPADRFAAPARP
jgi:photosynthetic reaction center cytochrome c subunit